MYSILEKVNLEFNLDDIKRIMYLLLSKKVETNAYDCMKEIVNDQTEIQNYDEFILFFYNSYVSRMNCINFENIKDEKLKNDYLLIKNSNILQKPNSINELFESKEYEMLNYKPIIKKGNFTYVEGSYINNFEEEEIECRFYISPKMENLIELVNQIIIKHNKEGLPCYFKFSSDSKRNDRIIFYSSYKNAEKHLQILETIKKENPLLFFESNKNPLWGNINGTKDIYFGAEPYYKNGNSYGSLRGAIIDETLDDFKKLYGEIESKEITDEMAIRFKRLLDYNCILNGINQNNFCLNKNNTFAKDIDRPSITLGQKNGEEIPIFIHWGNFEKNTALISNSPINTDVCLEISLEELDLLYKRDNNDKLYDKSEFVRGKISSEFQNLIKKDKVKQYLNKFNIRKKIDNKSIVQKNIDGKVIVGEGTIDYNLYMLLPYKISQLIVKLKLQKQNRKKNISDPILTREISIINNELSNYDSNVIKKVKEDVVQNEGMTQLDSMDNYLIKNNLYLNERDMEALEKKERENASKKM